MNASATALCAFGMFFDAFKAWRNSILFPCSITEGRIYHSFGESWHAKLSGCFTTAHHYVFKSNPYSRTALQVNIGL